MIHQSAIIIITTQKGGDVTMKLAYRYYHMNEAFETARATAYIMDGGKKFNAKYGLVVK